MKPEELKAAYTALLQWEKALAVQEIAGEYRICGLHLVPKSVADAEIRQSCLLGHAVGVQNSAGGKCIIRFAAGNDAVHMRNAAMYSGNGGGGGGRGYTEQLGASDYFGEPSCLRWPDKLSEWMTEAFHAFMKEQMLDIRKKAEAAGVEFDE